MDADCLGRKLLLTPSDLQRTPEKQTVGTVTSHRMLTLQALSSSLMPALKREAARTEERLLGDLRQPVPQNGRVRLHIIDRRLPGDSFFDFSARGQF